MIIKAYLTQDDIDGINSLKQLAGKDDLIFIRIDTSIMNVGMGITTREEQ